MKVRVTETDILSGGDGTTDNPIALAFRRATGHKNVSVIGSEVFVTPAGGATELYQRDVIEDWLNEFRAGRVVGPFEMMFNSKDLAGEWQGYQGP